MSEIGLIENYYAEQNSIIELLYSRGEVSLAQTAQNLFAKSLLLIAASHFEDRLKQVVTSGIASRSRNDPYINAFFKIRGISYQYHAWFDWDKSNANRFYSFFGKHFSEDIKAIIDADEALSESVTSFVKIGDLRNQIVHNNILVFKLNDTPAQVLERIKKANSFISLVEKVFSLKEGPDAEDAA
jgi:RiboL-PSP-HEPN